MRAIRIVGLTVLVGLLIAGCGTPPEEAERMANEAMDAAAAVKAAKYAPDEWQMAEDTLQAARSTRAAQDDRFALFRNYGDAERMFNQTTVLANNARTVAEAQLEIVKSEARILLDQSTARVDSLSTVLSKVRPRKDNRAEIEVMKQDLLAFAAQLQDAESDFSAGDYDSAKLKVDAVIEKVTAFESGLQRATGRR